MISLKNALLSTAVVALLAAPVAARAAETYTIDGSHTAVEFAISHFDFSRPSGKFMASEGTLTLDEQKPENSKITVTFPISSLTTGVVKLDEHLKNADFFDAAKYPTAVFTSSKVEVTGKDTAKVTGALTLHGVTKDVTLDVKLNKIGENMMKKKTAGFAATTTIKRSDFGMVTYLPGLGDDVEIKIQAEANLAAK